jgi:hypothetical protein
LRVASADVLRVAKPLGILFILLAIWIGLTVYQEGVDDAFGGVFAFFGSAPAGSLDADEEGHRPVTKRAAHAFQRAYDRSEDRVSEALEEDEGEYADDDEGDE